MSSEQEDGGPARSQAMRHTSFGSIVDLDNALRNPVAENDIDQTKIR